MNRIGIIALLLSVGCGSSTTENVAPATPTETHEHKAETGQKGAENWVCPMHPEIKASSEIACSKCGMNLVKQDNTDHSSHSHPKGGH